MSVAGLVVFYWLLRWVFKSMAQLPLPAPIPAKGPMILPPEQLSLPAPIPAPAPIILPPPPPRRPETVQLTLPLPDPPPPPPPPPTPVVQWDSDTELLAWRAWRLGLLLPEDGDDATGPILLSLVAPCVWNGPVVHEGKPFGTIQIPSGIYALKPSVLDRFNWQNEHCWVTGTIALSGRVVEHEIGYRAERAVVRELRLGVGIHLAVRSLDKLRGVVDQLEDRYQVSVNIGQSDREVADRMLERGHRAAATPLIWNRQQWRFI